MEYYLKCSPFELPQVRVEDYEQFITFKTHRTNQNIGPKMIIDKKAFPPGGEEWMIVPKKDVVRKDGSGLVRLMGIKMDEGKNRAFIKMYNSPDECTEEYIVPLEEIDVGN